MRKCLGHSVAVALWMRHVADDGTGRAGRRHGMEYMHACMDGREGGRDTACMDVVGWPSMGHLENILFSPLLP